MSCLFLVVSLYFQKDSLNTGKLEIANNSHEFLVTKIVKVDPDFIKKTECVTLNKSKKSIQNGFTVY